MSSIFCAETDANSYQLFSWGYYNFCSKNFATSEKFFNKFFEKTDLKDVQSPLIGYLNFLFETKNYQKFLALFDAHKDYFAQNEQIQFIHAMVLRSMSRFEESIQEFKNLNKKFPHNQELAYYAILASLTNLDFKNALESIENLFKSNSATRSNYVFHLLASRCYIGINDLKNAKSSIDKCVQLHPQSPHGWLMYGMIYKIAQEINNAIYGYSRLLDLVGSDKTIEQELFNLKIRQKSICQKSLDKAIELYNSNKIELALELLNKSFSENNFELEDFNTAMILKIEILTALNKGSDALKLLEQLIVKQPNNKVWYETLNLFYHGTQNKKEIAKLINKIAESQQQNILANLYAADIILRTDSAKGIKYCYKCINLTKDPDLKSKIIFQIASTHYQDKKFNELEKVLTENLNNNQYAPLINLAAYYYTTKGKNLKLAQELIDRIFTGKNENLKNNPQILDTRALIWYKNKEYDKAVKSFGQLAALSPDDKLIEKHLNKAKMKLNGSK